MRLLLTRAIDDAERTRAKLEAAGHTVLVSPVLEMVATRAAWPAGVVDALVATSSQAFQITKGWNPPTPEAKRLMPLFLVGARTEEIARQHGFHGPTIMAEDAGGLIEAFRQVEERPKRLVYIAGRERKPALEDAFRALDQPFDVLEVYATRRMGALSGEAVDALRAQAVDGVLHYSRRSSNIFVELAKSADVAIRAPIHFCLSDDVTGPLRRAACPRIEVAAAPDEAALLEMIAAKAAAQA